ncbi:MAG: translation initiation factor [Planctomycetales bacterium]|nr:translation initiation factor [Planctomycetales bacterium]
MGLFDGTPLERPVVCDRCGLDVRDCTCVPLTPEDIPPEKQRLNVRLEKRKHGRVVSVISGFACRKEQIQTTLTQLKNHCGAGGTVDGDCIILQGDHVQRVKQHLPQLGYRVK